MVKGANGNPDAGLRSLDHYRNRLPQWRYVPRQKLLPLVRYETPYLAWFQEKIRTPTLDSYFAFTANLGTHTFFMIFLPMLFWSGYTNLGRGFVQVLASGVFFSGFIKDLLCLPRPLSPPLQRITMSGSAALEYGFPSTHSTNAVSVAIYVLTLLNSPDSTLSSHINLIFQCMTYLYVTSIVLGRLYCGMHGFLDVIIGCLLGALITLVQNLYGPLLDDYVFSASGKQIVLVVLVIIILVRIHPEPADDCPCFDDSVAFAGVIIGVQLACWHFAKSSIAWSEPSPATIPFRYKDLGLVKTALRFVLGVLLIFTWREVMKPLLLRTLPPIFRALEKLGLLLPRRFFTRASQYKTVPAYLKDHDVLPSFADIPSILTNIRHPRRRAISIGPQSEADAYETMAYREKRRRESLSNTAHNYSFAEDDGDTANVSMSGTQPSKSARKQSKLDEYEHMMGTGISRNSPGTITDIDRDTSTEPFPAYEEEKEPDFTEVFSQVKKPRVRYDVEVVTKLVVYSGIAWVTIEGAPIVFDKVGLGL
ncbi:hypothetical protein Aspvir_003694 [Aspergillus viridinutans]|uniref:Phosphatidic acid phosphatase type 2/haloperoxidase domain-containing protein n=1 Tax=Aspergillus viridinutans TaxID=75553 RepID=A0A9P3BNN3_ASPVI|nr:uncharacterized protein Aspvir_003694 [Aspergillus viridinutans]GIJ99692.1 hypothetical protein Aspvir_003694 [Aspergillus viridinutans]